MELAYCIYPCKISIKPRDLQKLHSYIIKEDGLHSYWLHCLLKYLSQASSESLTHQLLLILPLQDVKGPRAGWERGLEILPGAQIAQWKWSIIVPIHKDTNYNWFPTDSAVIGFLCHNEVQVVLDSPLSVSSV